MMTVINYFAGAAIGVFCLWVAWQIFQGSVLKPYLLRKKILKIKEGQKFATEKGVCTALYNGQDGKYVLEKLSGKCIKYSQITEVF